ncbi:PREDICTED: regulatory protein NPR1 [Tarenaya hassleriana]|uniref:regulatory protein NPR1 n=1 Tax=Tarenaya hassleriana TaxID=28532 RepID=UPI00053C5DCC|nr:PREDICTED: regulatory protein NPR1 [Tarenaya hassleriana]
MDNRGGFSDSNEISYTTTEDTESSIVFLADGLTAPEVSALQLLSCTLESVFDSPESFYSDAKLVLAGGEEVSVHRCVLSSRSPFFKSALAAAAKEKEGGGEGSSGAVKLELKEVARDYEVCFDSVVAVLAYLYSGKVRPPAKGVSDCVDEDCSHSGCRPALDFVVEVLYLAFVFQIPELVTLYQRHLLDIIDKVAKDDILIILKVANICGKACKGLSDRCIDIIVKSDVAIVSLEKSLPHHIVKQIIDTRKELGLDTPQLDKHVRNIHKALDSDDVELVRMLLKEGHTNLDDACALHFAVAYCDLKTTTELLDLGLADVNHRCIRGYTVLHVAAMRKEPKLIVSLLTKGARASDTTPEGMTALQIAKRLTKAADYNSFPVHGKPSSKDRLCIEILEQLDRRDLLPGEASLSLAMAGEELKMKLLYLENRVALAKLLFPREAQLAMEIAQVDGTCEFTLASLEPDRLNGSKRTAPDLNIAPFKIQEEHLRRHRALSKTVELGKCYFPRCSAVLDQIMDAEDLSQLACIENDTIEERLQKKQRYMELQDALGKAFNEDKENFDKSSITSSSSSTSKSTASRGLNGKLTQRH